MRILSLQFCNLNSLRGRHEIDFESAPLSQSGIFAITGPTGAGKTTILDAITLALYGRAARYERAVPAETMSRHTGECFAEVHFECQGQRLGARWELRRARAKPDGALQSPKRLVYDLETKDTLVAKVKEVDDWIANLTGLDYPRFLRSVLLAQGDFTAFLKASDKERGQLLEKLTGMEIYAELSKLAHEVAREKKEKALLLQEKSNALAIWDEETRLTKKKALTSSKNDLAQLESTTSAQRRQHAALERWQGLGQRYRRQQEALKTYQDSEQAAKQWRRELAQHRRIEPHGDDLLAWRETNKQSQQIEEDQRLLQARLRKAEEAHAMALKANQEHSAHQQTSAKQLDQIGRLIEQVAPLDREWHLRRENINLCRSDQAEQREALATIDDKRSRTISTRRRLRKDHHDLNTWITKHREDGKLTEAVPQWQRLLDRALQVEEQAVALEKRHASQSQRFHELREQLTSQEKARDVLARSLDSRIKELETLEAEASELAQNGGLAEQEERGRVLRESRLLYRNLRNLGERYELESEKLKALRNQRNRWQSTLQSLKERQAVQEKQVQATMEAADLRRQLVQRGQEIRSLREALRPGDPCSVCGATEHPWSGQLDSATEEAELQAQEAKLKQEKDSLEKSRHEGTRLETLIDRLTEEEKDSLEDLDLIEKEAVALQEPLDPPISCRHLEKIDAELANVERQQIKEDEILRALRKQQQRIEAARRLRDTEQAKWQHVEQQIAKIRGQRDEWLQQEKDHRSTLDKAQQKSRDALVNLRKALPQSTAALEALDALTAYVNTAGKRAKAFQEHLEESQRVEQEVTQSRWVWESLQKERRRLKASLESLDNVQTEETSKLKEIEQQRHALIGDRDLLTERERLKKQHTRESQATQDSQETLESAKRELNATRALHSEAEKTGKEVAKRLDRYRRSLLAAAQALEIETIERLDASFLPLQRVRELTEKARQLESTALRLQTDGEQITSEADTLRKQLGDHLPKEAHKLDSDFDITPHTQALQSIEERLEQTKKACWSLEKECQDDEAKRASLTQTHKDLEKAENERGRWQELDALIGSADGSQFSRFAQSLTLKRLAQAANSHLGKLTDRYQIECVPEKELEIQIVDRYQANATRSMQSLSGGEGFLTSLALALGLAELAGGRGRIESLFIDEGFGTLDSESLETAIRALESLQSQNKTIGIISHTELLKERITSQIQVQRGQGGVSSLKIVS